MINWFLNLFQDRTFGAKRSNAWPEFRRQHIKKECELCGEKGKLLSPLELHHLRPVHFFPLDELNPDNVVTGCRSCHLKFYHLGSFHSFNLDIKEDIKIWQLKRKNRP